MPDPVIHSSSWTGSIEDYSRSATNGIGVGTPWVMTDAERRANAEWKPPERTPAVKRWASAFWAALLSPLALFVAYFFVHAASPDTMFEDHRGWLMLWGLGVLAVLANEFGNSKLRHPNAHAILLALVFASTLGFAGWYSYAAITSHAGAKVSKQERTFEFYHQCGRGCGYYLHQRADGTTVEGVRDGHALPYGPTCAITQRLDGEYGFTWVRVLDRSPRPAHDIPWPIRREDCFSEKPLATLTG